MCRLPLCGQNRRPLPAGPGWTVCALSGTQPLPGRHSCRAGERNRWAAGCCGRAFLPSRAGTRRERPEQPVFSGQRPNLPGGWYGPYPACPRIWEPLTRRDGVRGKSPPALSTRTKMPFRPWSHWSGWCCLPCCRPRYDWRCGWSGQTGGTPLFLRRRTVPRSAVSARWLSAPFLPCRGGNCLSPPHPAQTCWPRWMAAHSCGDAGFQGARSFSGSAGAARRPGQCLLRRYWYVSAGRTPGTNFPAGCLSAGRYSADRCCDKCTCRRHVFRRNSGSCPRPHCAAHRLQRSTRRQRNRQAVLHPALRSQKSGLRWSVRRPRCRRTGPRRRWKNGSR